MRIALDASSLLPPRTGVGRYTYHLVRELLRLDHVNDYTLFLNSLRRSVPDELNQALREGVHVRRRHIPGAWLHRAWRRFGWPPFETLAGPADIVHAPAGIIPPVRETPLVLTLHDCYFMRQPENCHALGGRLMRETVPGRIQQCAAVICVSYLTRQEALDLFGLDPERAHVVHSGVDHEMFRPISDPSRLEKNLEGLLRAMARLKRIMKEPPKLVCVGAEGFQTSPIHRAFAELKLQDDVFFTGYVPDDVLPVIYNLATALAAVSSYEGFGLPVLEAMACGAPVVATEAFREAAGDAAIYVPPDDPEQIARALKQVAGSLELQVETRRKGLERARGFSWRETARKTLAVYERVHGQQPAASDTPTQRMNVNDTGY
jgi:glycosyltransferase involved in cell wall biosynthesis